MLRKGLEQSNATIRWTVACRRLDGGNTFIFFHRKRKKMQTTPFHSSPRKRDPKVRPSDLCRTVRICVKRHLSAAGRWKPLQCSVYFAGKGAKSPGIFVAFQVDNTPFANYTIRYISKVEAFTEEIKIWSKNGM